MSESHFDVVVIGSGPGGEGAAMQAVKNGKRVAIVERFDKIGGGCTHWATIPSKALRSAVFQMTEEGQRLSYETWKTDLHFLTGSRMGKMVDGYMKQKVPFKEVTVEWQLQHPEINAGRSELIKILTTKR